MQVGVMENGAHHYNIITLSSNITIDSRVPLGYMQGHK